MFPLFLLTEVGFPQIYGPLGSYTLSVVGLGPSLDLWRSINTAGFNLIFIENGHRRYFVSSPCSGREQKYSLDMFILLFCSLADFSTVYQLVFNYITPAGLMVTAILLMFETLPPKFEKYFKPLIQICVNLGIMLICCASLYSVIYFNKSSCKKIGTSCI